MDWPCQCAAIVPCFQEAASIGEVVRAVRQYMPTVLVVDDGSHDGTAAAAEAARAEVLRHPANQGKGAALLTGWNEARRRGFTWALCLDGDGQHDPREIPGFLVRAAQTQADLVVGNRFGPGHDAMPPLRRVVNRWMSRRLSARAGQPLPDSQCGFRLLRLAVLDQLTLVSRRFEIESELLLKAARAGRRIEFVTIHAIYRNHASRIQPLADAWRWLKWWRTPDGPERPAPLNQPV